MSTIITTPHDETKIISWRKKMYDHIGDTYWRQLYNVKVTSPYFMGEFLITTLLFTLVHFITSTIVFQVCSIEFF